MLRAPPERRSLNKIVEEAIKVVEHRRRGGRLSADARELFRTRMKDRIRREQGRPPPVVRKRSFVIGLEKNVKALRRARAAAAAMQFQRLARSLERKIIQVEYAIEQVRGLPRQHGSKHQLDPRKCSAVRAAADLLDPSVERCRVHLSLFPDVPHQIAVAAYRRIYGPLDGECPWRRRLMVYRNGAWHKLARLIHEALTGATETDLMHYLRIFAV
jgi:hypothetical protein